MKSPTTSWVKDTAERVLRATIIAWLSWWVALADHEPDDLFSQDALTIALTAAAMTMLVCLGASQFNSQHTASFQKQPPPS